MTELANIESMAADWVARRDRADWSAVDQQALDSWLDAAVTHRIAYLRLQSVWQRADQLAAPASAAQTTSTRLHATLPRFSRWRIAASVILAVATGLGLWINSDEADKLPYQTAIGVRNTVALPDGTQVQLNTDTRIQVQMQRQTRQVWLEQGEIFLDVAHDAGNPFTVIAGHQRITVLGTQFSVRRDGEDVSVAVVQGSVRLDDLSGRQPANPIVMARNDVASVRAGKLHVAARSPQQLADELSWRNGQLSLTNLTLGEAAQQFNRYNAKKLVITDAQSESIVIGGRFDATNVEGFARLVQQGFGLTVRDEGDKIFISGKRTGF